MNFKSGFISIIGRPNTGKSTLVNFFTGQKISIISPKPQTTRNTIRAILTDDASQMVFMDTPGIHKPKNKLGQYMVNSAVSALSGVDLILYVTEPSGCSVSEIDADIISRLKDINITVVAVINKSDKFSEKAILETIKALSNIGIFSEIIPVSALTGHNTHELKKIIIDLLPEGPRYFEADQVTDQPEKNLAAEFIREKLLIFLREEIPHGTGVEVFSFKEREDKDIIDIQANIYCEKKTHKSIIIGKDGFMLKKIASSARKEIEALLGSKVYLSIWVKVKEDWRNKSGILKTMGYE